MVKENNPAKQILYKIKKSKKFITEIFLKYKQNVKSNHITPLHSQRTVCIILIQKILWKTLIST